MGGFERRVIGSVSGRLSAPFAREKDHAACDKGAKRGFEYFGLPVREQVEARNTNENAERFTDRQVIAQCHQQAQ